MKNSSSNANRKSCNFYLFLLLAGSSFATSSFAATWPGLSQSALVQSGINPSPVSRSELRPSELSQPTLSTSGLGWPAFATPDVNLLMQLNYIDVKHCPKNQGKLLDKAEINISQYLCKTYCPSGWKWITESDEQCHDLKDFTLQNFMIYYYRMPNENLTSHSVIKAFFGPLEDISKTTSNSKTSRDSKKNAESKTSPDPNDSKTNPHSKTSSASKTNSWFKFSMSTPPGEHWYCIIVNANLPLLGCANDI
jgi:hypothetical protein